ncbi:MAG: extracellular solute-binding protein [Alphaproteobacteria bacterium]|nr:ABC transporter substrate-binding protein [Alphaproteobacteria bacterium]TAD91954.1 MAG: extracellular solute-binding protein [Alphaproteobacteria bacterium]
MRTLWTVIAAAAMGVAFASGAHAQALSGTLTLYTSQPEADARRTIEGFNRLHPGVRVETFRSGTTEVMNRLQAEFSARAPQPDVLLIADAMTMAQLKQDNRLAAYREADVSLLPPGSYDADRTWFGTKRITTGILVHANAPFQPESWADLARPEAQGQVVMPSPLYSGAAAIHFGTLGADPALGWPWIERLARQRAIAVRGNGQVLRSVATGERMFGVIVDFMGLNEQAKGAPVRFIFPREGVTGITEPVAMLSTARNPAAARAFIDFLLSRAGQDLSVAMGYMPIGRGVPAPATFPALETVKLLESDIQMLLRTDEQTKERFANLFGG